MTIEKCQEDLVRSDLRPLVEAVREAGSRAMGGMLDMGRELLALKAACRHGEWGSAVQAAGVPERTAQRLMRAWREQETHGTLANPPSVTALLEAARDGKPDSVSYLDASETEIKDPNQLYEQIEVFEGFGKGVLSDESLTFGEQFAFACWGVRREDSGVDARLRVHSIISEYATVFCVAYDSGKAGTLTEKEVTAVNVMHDAVLVGLEGFYKKAAEVMGDPRFKGVTFEDANWVSRQPEIERRKRRVAKRESEQHSGRSLFSYEQP